MCEVCGSILTANDAPERVQAHLTGKQHTGFLKLRETYEALKVCDFFLWHTIYFMMLIQTDTESPPTRTGAGEPQRGPRSFPRPRSGCSAG